MTDLSKLFFSLCDSEPLQTIAKNIGADVKKVSINRAKTKMQIWLALTDDLPDGEALLCLEKTAKEALQLQSVRVGFYKAKKLSENPDDALRNLLSWVLSSIGEEDPMFYALIKMARFTVCDKTLIGALYQSFDTSLEQRFQASFCAFSRAYLLGLYAFTWRMGEASSKDHVRDAIIEAEKETKKELSRALEIQAKVKPASPPVNQSGAPPTTGSWVQKARSVTKEKKDPVNKTRYKRVDDLFWGRWDPDLPQMTIDQLGPETGQVQFFGDVEIARLKLTKAGNRVSVQFYVTDETAAVTCLCFMSPETADTFEKNFSAGGRAGIQANVHFDDRFSKDLQAVVEGVRLLPEKPTRTDQHVVKRVELHCHTKMSEKDAIIDVDRLFLDAYKMGHRALAITDHGVVQGFPEAYQTCMKINAEHPDDPMKPIFGMEGYMVDDGRCAVYGEEIRGDLFDGYVAIDVETTGLDTGEHALIEIGAVHFIKNANGDFVPGEHFQTFVSPGRELPDKISKLTGIGPTDLIGAPCLYEAARRLSSFIAGRPICGHHVTFDLGHLRKAGFDIDIEKKSGFRIKFDMPAIDTLQLARHAYPELDRYSLGSVAKHLQIEYNNGHRAKQDALISGMILAQMLKAQPIDDLSDLNTRTGLLKDLDVKGRKQPVYHIVLLAQSQLGLYHLYRLVSYSHLRTFSMRPRIPRSLLENYRAGLVIGSACERGEVYTRVLEAYVMCGKDRSRALETLLADRSFKKMLHLYDYIEIQPLDNNAFFLRDDQHPIASYDELEAINGLLVDLAEAIDKPVCATTDAHFFEQNDGEYRQYLLMDMGYKDAHITTDLYYRTTDEMLNAFSYLGDEKARKTVIENPRAIADRLDNGIKPFPDGTYPPSIASAADELSEQTLARAMKDYGHKGVLPDIVRDRVKKELKAIIGNGFAIMYYIAYQLVKKSNDDGYLVGSRGSVGSSLVAYLCGISEVNPLPPHYYCPSCAYADFNCEKSCGSGYDLPKKTCPRCQTPFNSDGQHIPFETFLGFYGDKQPDIDLNFSGEYQLNAHRYVEKLFGKAYTFRAGTIGCFAEKNALALVRKIQEERNESLSRAELRRRCLGLIGVKRTTGQHPGGIVVVPKEMDINEFTPVQHPANKAQSGIVTTHFDFNAMHDTILKLDILGHYDPTMLRRLGDMTGVDVKTIPVPEPRVMSLMQSNEALGIESKADVTMSATLGLSEMGTFMARDMIAETRPQTFHALVQLLGLSHGTDVWKGNAQDLIREGTCTLDSVIGCRDSIMTQLIGWGLENKAAFDIMERVRKGRGLLPKQETAMRAHKVPAWYINSCKKIKYMFPKAHAVAYAISSLRIAWFKIYYPVEYYCAFFTVRADEFDGSVMCGKIEKIRRRRKELFEDFSARKPTEKAEYYLCELVEEMIARKISFLPYDLDKSDATAFVKVSNTHIRPPLNAIPMISTAMAKSICLAREDGPFKSRDDLAIRSGIGPSAMEKLVVSGVLDHLEETSQIDMFSMLKDHVSP